MGETICDACGKVYNAFIGDRFWSGNFTITNAEGETEEAETLCDSCHREHART